MSVLYFFILGYVLSSISLYFVFPKAGEAGWKALVPGLNFVTWCRIIGQPSWWAALLLIPIVNLFIWVGMAVDLVRSFEKYSFWHSALAVIFAPVMFFWIGLDKNAKYTGPAVTHEGEYKNQLHEAHQKNDKRQIGKLVSSPYRKSVTREWVEAVVFAVFAAAFIRMFLIEAYVIPTSSMEGSLLVGDFLFVSKAHYGIRTPMTVLQVPLLHNRIPFLDCESYLNEPKLPYYRLPALNDVKHNDPVVFNYPEGDSVYVMPERTYSIYDTRRDQGVYNRINSVGAPLTTRPLDKEDHYIKRCIGLPDDTLQIINQQVYINGKPAANPSHLQYSYHVSSTSTPINTKILDDWGVHLDDHPYHEQNFFNLNKEQVEKIKAMGGDIKVEPAPPINPGDEGRLFPHDTTYFKWTVDNYGPIYIPKKGVTVTLKPENIDFYRRIIHVYEGNKLEERDGKFIINDKETTTYTFQQNYYWMMGDNRHNSEDSRFWGFVPEDHIVGKPLFIWFSTKNGNMFNGINFKRLFTGANKM